MYVIYAGEMKDLLGQRVQGSIYDFRADRRLDPLARFMDCDASGGVYDLYRNGAKK